MTNRLAQETSPYLLQHAENPVDWYPWGAEALERAKRERKPILLSVGYSACHWCHVMEHESFENAEIAGLMNASFICIKVDREERPDIDQVYQNVALAMTGGGGWPLTVFLTPELRPFFGGTYFPPEERYGRPGFPRLLEAIARAFRDDPEGVAENARKLTEYIQTVEAIPELPVGAAGKALSADSLEGAAEKLLTYVDRENGGLGHAPKFPNAMTFSFLWRYGTAGKDPKTREAALLALRSMARGGIYDQLGGGFHRYSVDASWSVPHFEKMLYDNGLLLKLYSEVLLDPEGGLSAADRDLFLSVVSGTVDYLLREMVSPEGGFYSSQDADSEGVEGKFFVWDPEEIRSELSGDEAEAFLLRYGVTEEGNFEEGKTVLHLSREIREVADFAGISEAQARALLEEGRRKLLERRSKRQAPALDDKILAGWNGLAISGLSWASRALSVHGRPVEAARAKGAAERCFSFLSRALASGDPGDRSRIFGSMQKGTPKLDAYLDDYAFLAMAALDIARLLAGSSDVAALLEKANAWCSRIVDRFKESAEEGGKSAAGYYFTSDLHERLIQRPKSVFDQAIPSGTSVALTCMLALSELGFDFRQEVDAQLREVVPIALGNPQGASELLCLALLKLSGPVVLSGDEAQIVCRHPHIYRKPVLPGASGEFLVCHANVCGLPTPDSEAALREARAKIALRTSWA